MAQKRHRLAQRRKAVGLSQEGLAELIGVDRSTVVRWERGETHPHPWHRPRLARVLTVSIEDLAELLAPTDEPPEEPERVVAGFGHPRVDRMVRSLRARLLVRGLPAGPEPDPSGRGLAEVEAEIGTIHRTYQRADYTAAVRALPALLTDAERLARPAAGQPAEPAHRLLAISYLAASKLAAKLGDGVLAWVAADRVVSSALVAGDRAVAAVGAYQVARSLLQEPERLDDAGEVLDAAIDDLARHSRPDSRTDLSVRGALLLLASVVAARGHRPTAAARQLAAAAELAELLRRDENRLWTGFGPTNVRIHQVSVAVELRRPERAIEIGNRLDTSALPPPLVSRRAQVHLDLAAALCLTSGGGPAGLLHLLEAERIAPELVRVSYAGRSLVGELLRHERRARTPGLRQLAARAGVLD